MTTVVDLYTIQIIRDEIIWRRGYEDVIEGIVAETEENVNDLLPAGYRARIRKWDQPEGNDDE